MKIGYVSAPVAWGGHLAYLGIIQTNIPPPQNLPFHIKWIIPDRRFYNIHGQLIIETQGFCLKLTAELSNIPGAGLGLFLRIRDVSGCGRKHYVLSQGNLLCVGPYGPLRASDWKSTAVFETKSFIYEYAPESYCFESSYDGETFYIDPTNDEDGQLHSCAKSTLLCRVNEVDVGEIPSVCADIDPSGSIQYYLGHKEAGNIDMNIPVDCPYELKVCFLLLLLAFTCNTTIHITSNILLLSRLTTVHYTSYSVCGVGTQGLKAGNWPL
jgi:hypothetical protein